MRRLEEEDVDHWIKMLGQEEDVDGEIVVHQVEVVEMVIPNHEDIILMALFEESRGGFSCPPLMKHVIENYGKFISNMGEVFPMMRSDGNMMGSRKPYDLPTPPFFRALRGHGLTIICSRW